VTYVQNLETRAERCGLVDRGGAGRHSVEESKVVGGSRLDVERFDVSLRRKSDALSFAPDDDASRMDEKPRGGHPASLGQRRDLGKVVAAAFLHEGSKRAKGPWVAYNAACFSLSRIDFELYSNAANYPSPGMPERKGLVCMADHGTLLLDQVGDCAEARRAPISLYVASC
jgi:hypothetical protein